jgi:hypothetical protein
MTVVDPETLVRRLPEKDLRQCVVDTAQLFKWLVYWTWRSDHSPAGFPDLVLVAPPPRRTILYIELKRDDRARLRPDQQVWADRLLDAGQDWRRWSWTTWQSGEVERALRED